MFNDLLKDNDELIAVKKTTGNDMVLLGSTSGKVVKFNETEIRQMGRTASGVKGIELSSDECVCAEIVSDENKILIVTVNGYGKQTKVEEYRQTRRGSKGVKGLNITDKNGTIKIAVLSLSLLLISCAAMSFATSAQTVSAGQDSARHKSYPKRWESSPLQMTALISPRGPRIITSSRWFFRQKSSME